MTVAAIAEPARAVPPSVMEDITYGSVFSSSLKIVPEAGHIDQIP